MAKFQGQLSISEVFNALEILLTPDFSTKSFRETTHPLSELLQQNLHKLEARLSAEQCHCLDLALKTTEREFSLISDIQSEGDEWHFVSTCLCLLYLLSSLLLDGQTEHSNEQCQKEVSLIDNEKLRHNDVPPLITSVLSMTQMNTVKNALQFVTCLGISPNLETGVGIPLQHRSKYVALAPFDVASISEKSNSLECSKARLSCCLLMLAKLLEVPQLQSVLVNTHLSDMLAALLQLLYAYSAADAKLNTSLPQHNKDNGSNTSGETESFSSSTDQIKITSSEGFTSGVRKGEKNIGSIYTSGHSAGVREDASASLESVSEAESKTSQFSCLQLCRNTLESLLKNTSHSLLIRELLVLQSGVPAQIQNAKNLCPSAPAAPPAWLKRACSQLLLRLVKGPEGISNLYTALSDGTVSSSCCHLKQCGVVAKIIASCPVPPKLTDHYVSSVSQQLIALLQSHERDITHLTHLVGAVASQMTVKYREHFHHHFHQPLLEPLLRCLKGSKESLCGTVLVSEQELNNCLENMLRVYVTGQPPQAAILSVLEIVIGVLWSIFSVTRLGVHNIRQYVRELILSYLKYLGCKEAATCLKLLCVTQLIDDVGSCSPITVYFETGSNGGLQAVYKDTEKVASLGDTQRVDAVIDILQDLKTHGVAGELLVSLLKELTEMISQETQSPGIVLPGRFGAEVGKEEKLLLFKRVILLHLLASICETFGAECLSDNTQVLLFVKASLERGVAICRATAEEEMVIFETETMSMAMGLLTAVMAGALKMEEKHSKMLDEMLPLLDIIGGGHPDEFIKEMASDIRIAIATRGAVWSSLEQNRKVPDASKLVKVPLSSGRPIAKSLIEELPDHPVQDASQTGLRQPADSIKCDTDVNSTKLDTDVNSTKLDTKNSTKLDTDVKSAKLDTDVNSTVQQLAGEEKGALFSPATHDLSVHSCNSSRAPVSLSSNPVIEKVSGFSQLGSSEELGQQNVVIEDSGHLQQNIFSQDNQQAQVLHDVSGKSRLQTVFEELCDPLLPVRGHALITLAHLVRGKDPETLSQKEVVQKVFEENLRHGDSYLYLTAINGMTALADCFPESVVPTLAAAFAGFSRTSPSKLTAEHRLKIGEALMKATRNLGELIPKYREVLLAAFLTGAGDKDATVRASSISNLAELCHLLRFSLGSVLQEVFSCCSRVLETDEAIVRQAAALTLTKILEGLDRDALSVLDSVLKNLYRLLKKLHTTDTDAAVRLHANMALVQLDAVARDFLFPKQTLQKKIQILSNEDTYR